MKNLLIDIGNSVMKACMAKAGSLSIGSVSRLEYDKKDFLKSFENFILPFSEYSVVAAIGISLLDRRLKEPVANIVQKHFPAIPHFVGPDSDLPFQLKYAKTIGSDRLCSSSAAFAISGKKIILTIDFGTATTFTVIRNSVLIGGMISPGVGTSYHSLISKTTLPQARLKFPRSPVSSTTQDNISGGVLFQSLFTAERYIEEIRRLYGKPFVFCTGGYSAMIRSKTAMIDRFDRNLVLKGINYIISR